MEEENFLNFEDLDTEIQSILDHSELQNNLKIQLEEIEVLQAMYYKEKEFIINKSILTNVDHYVREITHHIPPLIDFSINLKLNGISLEFQIVLSRTYPTSEPQIIVRSNQLSRYQQNSLNDDLKLNIESLDRGVICIYECISWVTDNLSKYYEQKTEVATQPKERSGIFSRYWIYSHHIYSKEKRKDIISLARQHHITGFCLSGKPGVICVEGLNADCEEWWQKVSLVLKRVFISMKYLQSNHFAD